MVPFFNPTSVPLQLIIAPPSVRAVSVCACVCVWATSQTIGPGLEMPSQIGFGKKTLRDYIFQVVTNIEKQLPVSTAGDFQQSSYKDENMLKPLGLLP